MLKSVCCFVADSCHSGTLLDQVEVPVDGPTEGDPELPEETECAACDASTMRHK
jgi:hypothetical protein